VKQNGEDTEEQGKLDHRTTNPEASVLLKYDAESKGNQILMLLSKTGM
jgi:hypothetical protein